MAQSPGPPFCRDAGAVQHRPAPVDLPGSRQFLQKHPQQALPHAGRLPVAQPTAEYAVEAGGYDHSIKQNITLNLPAGWLMEALGLRLSDGRSIEFHNDNDEIVFFDPSVQHAGLSTALVERTAFLEMLRREGLVAVWAVAGEKSVFGEIHSDGFGGRRAFTRLFFSEGGKLEALPRFETFDKPSTRQRAALFGQSLDGLSDDEDSEDTDA